MKSFNKKYILIFASFLLSLSCYVVYSQELHSRWDELTASEWSKALQRSDSTCILPIGILEKHGPHVPIGSDLIQVREWAARATRQEYAVVFPDFFYGQINEARHQFGDYGAVGALRQILHAHEAADRRQRGGPLADPTIDVARLHRRRRILRLELEVQACERAEQRRPPDAQDAALRDDAALEDFLLQLRAERNVADGSDHGDERAGEEGDGRGVLCEHGR